MQDSHLQQLLPGVIAIAKKAGAFIRLERGNFSYKNVEVKGLNDLVSYVDRNAEEMIVEELARIKADAGFIVEENSRSGKKEWNWIVDPLDGTTNFIHGIPCFAVSIALELNGEIQLGVVYEVNRDECFYATKNGGSFLNNEPIKVSARAGLNESLIATGFPIYNFDRMEQYLSALQAFMRSTHGIRRIGAASADLCYLACGRVDAFFEYNLKPWDVAAGGLIVKEAGGIMTDFSGGNNWIYGQETLGSNSHLHAQFSKVIKDCFVAL